MAIQIGNYNFDGPFSNSNDLKNVSGVYAILGGNGISNWNVVDIGESEGVRDRVANHDRAVCWTGRKHPKLAAAALYVPQAQRVKIEQELRAKFNPPCGDR